MTTYDVKSEYPFRVQVGVAAPSMPAPYDMVGRCGACGKLNAKCHVIALSTEEIQALARIGRLLRERCEREAGQVYAEPVCKGCVRTLRKAGLRQAGLRP